MKSRLINDIEEDSSNSRFSSTNTLLYFILIIIIGNLFIIDVALFGKKEEQKSQTSMTKTPETQTTIPVSPTKIPSPTAVTKETKVIHTTTESSAGEFFIPLGIGSSTSTEWEDIPGAQAYVNSSLYKNIESVTFEASLYTPTGNQTAYARLYNVTDNHPVWYSEVSIEGGTPQLKLSNKISLDPGSKLYQVQMKTQLGARTNLENARIHIITN